MIRGVCLAVLLAASPAAAMTVEECDALQTRLAGSFPPAADAESAREVTRDGWCRVEGGPLAGLEWRADIGVRGFFAEARQESVEIDGLGDFGFAGQLGRVRSEFNVGPVALRRKNGDRMSLTAVLGAPSPAESGLGALPLEGLEVRVIGQNGLVSDILAWAFRVDIRRARSGFTVADDQRALMIEWFEALPEGFVDPASESAFREMVRAYPKARGTAVLRVPEDREVALGPLLGAVLFGTDLSEDAAATLVRDAGLTLAWEPE